MQRNTRLLFHGNNFISTIIRTHCSPSVATRLIFVEHQHSVDHSLKIAAIDITSIAAGRSEVSFALAEPCRDIYHFNIINGDSKTALLTCFHTNAVQRINNHLLPCLYVTKGTVRLLEGKNLLLRDPFQLWAKRCWVSSQAVPQLSSYAYQPKKYAGPSYEQLKNIRARNILTPFAPDFKEPLLIHDGKMQWLFDHTGRRYLDMFGGIVTVSVGHCHPKVTEAAVQQMYTIWHTSNLYLNPKFHEYAEKLTSKLPGDLKVVYFVNSGSEANDFAILLARLHTGNFDIISFRNGYHGMSSLTMALTAQSSWRNNLPLPAGFHHAMNPDVYQGLWGGSHCRDSPVQTNRQCDCKPDDCHACDMYYSQLEEIFKYSVPTGKVAGLFAESIQGNGGVIQFPKKFLKKAYQLVRMNGGVCIADEVQTGFGRTGEHFWGFEMHGVKPDIVTMAKGMCNGLPMAAVVTTPAVAESLKQARHFNTFGGNPVSCAAGLAVLKVIEEEKIQENAQVVGTYLLTKLSGLKDHFECIGDVRGKGLMVGVEMVTDKETKTPLPYNQFLDIWDACKSMGVLFGRGGMYKNIFRMKPPMCITKEDVDFAVSVFETAIRKQHMT